MGNLVIKEFNGNQVHTFIWNNKPCWIASEIVSMFRYADTSKTIQDCIDAEEFEASIEYDILRREDLKAFKSLTTLNVVSPNTPNLTIFYEDGIYGFLEYTHKPEGVQFRKFLRREVLPEIRQTGAYISDKANPEMLRAKADELENIRLALENLKAWTVLMDSAGLDGKAKLVAAKALYRSAGIELPINVELENKLYDIKIIAKKIGVLSANGKPHANAVSAIIKQCDIPEAMTQTVLETSGNWTGSVIKYKPEVISIVKDWLNANNYPAAIKGSKITYKVFYEVPV